MAAQADPWKDEGRGRGERRGERGVIVLPAPPPGECRLWLPDRPPGHQPPPGRC